MANLCLVKRLTEFAQGDQTCIDSQTQLHWELRRNDARDDEDTVEEKLALLEAARQACAERVSATDIENAAAGDAPLTQTYQLAAIAKI